MSEQIQQVAQKPKTVIGKVISLPLTIFGILVGSLLLSIIVEWLGIYFFWPEQGWHHSEAMFNSEMNQISTRFKHSILISEPMQFASVILEHAYDWIFIKSGLMKEIDAVLTPQLTDSNRKLTFRQYLNMGVQHMKTYLIAAAYTTLIFIVRVFILILSMPLIILAVFVGFIDGLVKRDIRRFTASHESGFIYHRAKAFLIPAITLPWVLYLALPISISPMLVMLPCACLAGVVMNITVSSFKKYL